MKVYSFVFMLNISKIEEKTIVILAIAGILQIIERVGNPLQRFTRFFVYS